MAKAAVWTKAQSLVLLVKAGAHNNGFIIDLLEHELEV